MELPGLPVTAVNWLLILTSLVLCAYAYLRHVFSYWDRRGVPSIHPITSFIGLLQFVFKKKMFMEWFDDQYKALEGHKFGGSFQVAKPVVVLRDPETIHAWLIKGFPNFHDRNPKPDENFDPLMSTLFQLTGDRWRQVRNKLSPAFSSAKMKIMYEALKRCAGELDAYFASLCSASGTGATEVEVKELMSNYTMDVIGACAMGIECNAIRDPNSEFKRITKKMFEFDLRKSIVFLMMFISPKLPKFFGLKPASPEVEQFFRNVCKETEEMKTKDACSNRKDFLQILMSLRAEEEEEGMRPTTPESESSQNTDGPVFTENIIVGAISGFLSAGLEPVALTLAFCLYELALNPEIQSKMFDEILSVKKEIGQDISYEALKKFKYTEQVINESLRKYPPATGIQRMCTEPFQIPDSSVVLDKGVILFVSSYSLQHDPKYFPDPEKFDPDRFSPENIDSIIPGSYLPFGEGPRYCIAMRLALMDIKTMLITIISNYEVETCTKTQIPLKFDRNSFMLSPEGGLWLRLRRRK